MVELAGGTVGGRDARGAKLELPAAELNRRLADQSKGAVKALRVVAVRGDDRWRVSLLASAAEHGRLAAGAAEPDWDQLAGAGQQAAPAAPPRPRPPSATWSTPPAAATRPPWSSSRRPSSASWPPTSRCSTARAPPCRRWAPCRSRASRPDRGGRRRRGQGAGDRRPAGRERAAQSLTLEEATAKGEAPYVVTIQQDGTWYPSLVFTVTDWMLNRAERERP